MPKLRIFGRTQTEDLPRPRVIFVSHEATRTGAPKIVLNILRHFYASCDVDCETIIHNDGHLLEEFSMLSQVHCLELPRQRSSELQKRVRGIVRKKRTIVPCVAISNSMESRFVSATLNEMGVPVITLLHELPCSYNVGDYQMVYDQSEKIVFPVQCVRESTHKKLPIPFGKDLVLPQGLLNSRIAETIDTEAARKQIRTELGLPLDSFVVLGCGTLDMRKGIDHFANIAKCVAQKTAHPGKIHFVWVGDGPRWPHSTFHYVQIDLRLGQTASNVHFIGEREHVDSYFVGSDMFLLPSRVDPFPCVIHEAMATRLPVMAFDNSGGAADAIDDGAGFIVPYGDYSLASSLICAVANNPGLADGIRDKALARVHEKYSFETYAENLVILAQSIAGTDFPRISDTRISSSQRKAA